MASLKLIFLVTLLLIALVGSSSAAGRCHSNRECPPCDIGDALCVGGSCSCTIGADVVGQKQNTACKIDGDCANLCHPDCRSFCDDGLCTCACSP